MRRFIILTVFLFGCSKQVDHTKYFDKVRVPDWKIPSELKVIEPPDDWKTIDLKMIEA